MKSEERIALDTFPEDWKYYTLTFPVARYKNLSLEGIIEEMRRRRSFETPVQRTKRKARAAAKRGRQRFRFTMEDPNAKEEGGGEEGAARPSDA